MVEAELLPFDGRHFNFTGKGSLKETWWHGETSPLTRCVGAAAAAHRGRRSDASLSCIAGSLDKRMLA
jgi:hypothetical protein